MQPLAEVAGEGRVMEQAEWTTASRRTVRTVECLNKHRMHLRALQVLACTCLRVTLTARRLGSSIREVGEILVWSEDYVSASRPVRMLPGPRWWTGAPLLPGPFQYRRFGPRLMAHQAPPKQMAAMRQTIPRVG